MKTNQEKIFIHIGHPKAASTFLQKSVFPNMKGIIFKVSDHSTALLHLLTSKIDWDESIAHNWINEQKKLADEIDKNAYVTISNEGLSGRTKKYSQISSFAIGSNIHKLFPKTKILILIRNQASFLESLYAFRVAVKGREFRNFKDFLTKHLGDGLVLKLQYEKLCQHYIGLFGRSNVLILPIELLSKKPDAFFTALSEFLGIDTITTYYGKAVNTSTKSEIALTFFRPLNFVAEYFLGIVISKGRESKRNIFYKWLSTNYNKFKIIIVRWTNPLLRRTKRISADQLIKELGYAKLFSETNKEMTVLTGINLGELGYPLE